MQKLSKKQFWKSQTLKLMKGIIETLLDEQQAAELTMEQVIAQVGRKTTYKDQETGAIHLGLCYKKLRGLVKENPYVTVEQAKEILGLA